MTFYEKRFPTDISGGATGGPRRVTDVVELRSGFEERNSLWAHSRRRWDAAYGIKEADDLHAVLEFWEEMRGPFHGFRWKDHLDFKSCRPSGTPAPADQAIGTGNGAALQFQLVKNYGIGGGAYVRPIKKPVAGTVRVALNGVEAVSGWTVNTVTGIVAFSVAPGNGVAVTAGFEFDVPVRFNGDELSTQLEAYEAGAATIEIMEIRI